MTKPESKGSQSKTASHVSCAHHCSCRKNIANLNNENQAIKMNQEQLFSSLAIERSFAHPPCLSKACSVADEATEVFSLAPTTDSREAGEKKRKKKERVFETKSPKRVSEGRKKEKKELCAEKRYAPPMIAPQVLLPQSPLRATGASGAAQVNPILASDGGIEDIFNPVRAKLRAIAKQPKYNGDPRWWVFFKREFSLWVGKNKLRGK